MVEAVLEPVELVPRGRVGARIEEVRTVPLPTALDSWLCDMEVVPGPMVCWPAGSDSLLGFELWCVPPTAPPTAAPMTTMVMAMMTMMPLRVRYHGTLVTTGSWPFDANSFLRA